MAIFIALFGESSQLNLKTAPKSKKAIIKKKFKTKKNREISEKHPLVKILPKSRKSKKFIVDFGCSLWRKQPNKSHNCAKIEKR